MNRNVCKPSVTKPHLKKENKLWLTHCGHGRISTLGARDKTWIKLCLVNHKLKHNNVTYPTLTTINSSLHNVDNTPLSESYTKNITNVTFESSKNTTTAKRKQNWTNLYTTLQHVTRLYTTIQDFTKPYTTWWNKTNKISNSYHFSTP